MKGISGYGPTGQLKNISGVEGIVTPGPKKAEQDPSGINSFGEMLTDKLKEVNELNVQADKMVQQAVTGGEVNPHNTLIALQKADISFRLLM